MNIISIKVTPKGDVWIEGIKQEGDAQDIIRIKSADEPRPELARSLNVLAEYVLPVLGLPLEYCAGLEVYALQYDPEKGLFALHCRKQLGFDELEFLTPQIPFDSMPSRFKSAFIDSLAEGRMYASGERAQQQLDFAETSYPGGEE